jgi:DNA-binding SARP family transcriptional activator
MRRGARCNNNEIIAVLWESKPDSPALQSQYRHLVSDLTRTLKSVCAGDILVKQRGFLAVIPEKLSCDLYDFYASDTNTASNYMGEFMMQYSWAEFINARLDKM